jgi:cytochrome c-type biogenesis protein CcmH/NrfG
MTLISKKLGYLSVITLLLLAAGLAACNKGDKTPAAEAPASQPSSQPGSQPPAVSVMGAKDQSVGMMERIQEYRQRLDKDPKDLEALIFLGNANYDIQRFDKAAEYYEKAIALDPKNLPVRTDLAMCYRNTGKVDQAVEELKQVLAMDPKHKTALYNLGFIMLNDKKDKKEALKAWDTLVSQNPTDPEYDSLRARIQQIKKGPAG